MIQRREPVALIAVINNTILNGPVNLCQIIKQTKMAYIQAALNYHDGNKSSAAKMLGLNNSQTLDNWLKN
jgi:DNA-binding protein Fis